MSDVALYRKYRPKKFIEVIGQDHVIKVLEGALKAEKVSHAYLFAGSRGTGKTSVARIFAEELGASANDVYEIDAASNRGIDDVRELREGVQVLPFESPYKVYIIDEVHMLTKEAFNALLKTLEEPPRHAIFILATTEMDRLPETIISRCQTFNFKRPSREVLRTMVLTVAKKEGFKLEPDAAELVATLGDGSFRDTHGMLQKVIASSTSKTKTVTREEVEVVTGAPRVELIHEVISSIATRDTEKGITALRAAGDANTDMKVFGKLLLEKMRLVLLLRYAPHLEKGINEEIGENEVTFLKTFVGKGGERVNSAALLEFLNAYDYLGIGAVPSLPLELAIIKLTTGS